ncbi:Purine catabolism regulatory protein [Jeotgalicoccus aerolatus]|uniref:Purine catabolism regulator n=1 Tax=Jeotgalicoccus aerolatus TaxID=709510 RepID=A0ABS4HNI2_9STAP|nr:PucR family transcriptional regulator [Jeotgalicoccus aerolatus]MBP1952458.1 purine catabolism regulator [Jeotgalicoccus aerolatus]NMA81432.1 PucR family transcriptional regulator [Jeotgalicoccus aerolatus]CAD2072513.1 Purine catabolism regulatory protein [Jeotgalicoccus aerolatus]GGE04439.1 PucR family transcriptional regulator [Jeotgalicoccus aerolatus]HJG32517.1 PucR family transcriptional regulator ligand-binding domain-containing protein [Jeotgalicoccus aerolatus]
MDYTVKELLTLPEFQNAQYIGTKQSLAKNIRGITIIDSPDISLWLNGGEAILTSFFPMRNLSDQEMKEWMHQLADKKISALIVKVRKELDNIPKPVSDVCKDRNIPIIILPKEIPFIDIIYKVTRKIFNQDVEKLEYFREIHHRFTELSIRNVSDEVIIEALESLIGNPVTIYNELFKVIATTDQEVELFYESDKFQKQENTQNTIFPIYRRFVIYPKLQDRECEQIMIPITTVNQTKVMLVISAIHSGFSDFDFIAIENAATALSLNLAKKIAISEVEKKYKNEIIDDLLSGNIKDEDGIAERAENINFDLNSRSAVVVFTLEFTGKKATSVSRERYYNILINNIDYYLKNAIVRERFNQVIVIWPIHSGQSNKKKEMDNIKRTLGHVIYKFESAVKDAKVYTGIGSIADTVRDLPKSHKEAQEVLDVNALAYGQNQILSFEELGIYRLLYQFKHDNNRLKEFIPASLQRLLDYNKTNREQLIETLEMYLQCQQNVSRSADRLFVHYKTVSYRLDRIKEITQMDYEDANEMLSVQVGLKILEILRKE